MISGTPKIWELPGEGSADRRPVVSCVRCGVPWPVWGCGVVFGAYACARREGTLGAAREGEVDHKLGASPLGEELAVQHPEEEPRGGVLPEVLVGGRGPSQGGGGVVGGGSKERARSLVGMGWPGREDWGPL